MTTEISVMYGSEKVKIRAILVVIQILDPDSDPDDQQNIFDSSWAKTHIW